MGLRQWLRHWREKRGLKPLPRGRGKLLQDKKGFGTFANADGVAAAGYIEYATLLTASVCAGFAGTPEGLKRGSTRARARVGPSGKKESKQKLRRCDFRLLTKIIMVLARASAMRAQKKHTRSSSKLSFRQSPLVRVVKSVWRGGWREGGGGKSWKW